MDKKKLLIRLTSLILFIFAINVLANKFYWYYSIWYFDMPMHFLGGFWLSLALVWLFPLSNVNSKYISKIILGALLIGIFWELFEILFNNYIAQNPFNTLDTLSDIFFDLAGATAGVLYFLKRIMPKEESKVQL
jgi:uncharacterized BrkB/YihY/UPF0761 family membrane protein